MPPGCYEPTNYTTICSMQAFMPPEEEAIVSGSFISCPLIYQASHPQFSALGVWELKTGKFFFQLSTYVSVSPTARSNMSCSSSVRGSGIFSYHSESTTIWHVEQERVPSHAPVVHEWIQCVSSLIPRTSLGTRPIIEQGWHVSSAWKYGQPTPAKPFPMYEKWGFFFSQDEGNFNDSVSERKYYWW